MKRRDFFKLGSVLAVTSAMNTGFSLPAYSVQNKKPASKSVNFIYDGSFLTSQEYAHLLMQLADEGKIKADYYSNGGVVEELEFRFAKWLGKESAVFMPTGTLANHIALRRLAGLEKRVIVQAESHIYNDSGDCAQILSGLNLIPLGTDRIDFNLDEVSAAVTKSRSGRVVTPVGVISIESPVRRKNDCMFGFSEMERISQFARQDGIRMHLDGARLFVESAHNGKAPADYHPLFDTIYTSLYKCFNAASGAVLAGSADFTKELFHVRRMFGGGLPAVWPFAAVALEFVDSFIDEYKAALLNAKRFFEIIERDSHFLIKRLPQGTHIFGLKVNETDRFKFRENLEKENILLGMPNSDSDLFVLKINPSLNRMSAEEIAGIFMKSLY